MKVFSLKFFLVSLTLHTMVGSFFIFTNQSIKKPVASIIVTDIVIEAPSSNEKSISQRYIKKKN